MKIKFRVKDPQTHKMHRLNVKGDSFKQCNKVLAARLLLMGVKEPDPKDIHFQILKK